MKVCDGGLPVDALAALAAAACGQWSSCVGASARLTSLACCSSSISPSVPSSIPSRWAHETLPFVMRGSHNSTAARTQAARTRRVALVFTTESTLNLHCIGLACRSGESQRARLLSARHRCPLPAFHTPRLTACSPYGLCSALGHARPCHADLILSLCCRFH